GSGWLNGMPRNDEPSSDSLAVVQNDADSQDADRDSIDASDPFAEERLPARRAVRKDDEMPADPLATVPVFPKRIARLPQNADDDWASDESDDETADASAESSDTPRTAAKAVSGPIFAGEK